MQDPFSFYVPISDKKTYIWYNVSCNVWLCMNEISEHLSSFFFIWIYFIPFSSFLVSSKMQNANVMPQLCKWNTMIGLTNVICKHCVLTCYWQTLNHWPRCQFFMNANKMWCKSRFFISDANAFRQRCNCNFHDADVLCRGASAKFIDDGASAHI